MKGTLQAGELGSNDVQNQNMISIKDALDWGIEVTLGQRGTWELGLQCLKSEIINFDLSSAVYLLGPLLFQSYCFTRVMFLT